MADRSTDADHLPRGFSRKDWQQLARWRRIMEKAARVATEDKPSAADDAALIALSGDLHAAARLAHRQLRSMPDYATTRAEAVAIEEILQPGEAIADRMLCLHPVTPEGFDARLRAGLWKRGEYISAYLA